MTTFETGSGRRLDIQLPPPGSLPGLEEATETYARLLRERKVTSTRLSGLRGDLERAKDQERVALAKALKEDKAPPKLTKVAKTEKDIEVAAQRLEALEEALDLATDDLHVVADDLREEWTETVLAEVTEAKTAYAQAVEEVDRASREVLAKIALLRFVRLFPEEETSYRVRGSNVLALRAPHGDPYSLDEVVQALRDDARVEYDPRAFMSRDALGVAIQARQEEKRRNEEKGLGFFTDEELGLVAADSASFYGGQGARLIRRMAPDTTSNNNGNENEGGAE